MKKRISVFSIVCLLLAAVSLAVVLYRMWWGEDLLFDWPRWMGNPFWFSLGASMIARPLFEASVAGGAVSIILDALGLRWQPPRWQKWLWIVPLILTAIYLMIFMGIWLSSRVWPIELMPVLSEVFPFSLLGVSVAFGIGKREQPARNGEGEKETY